MKMKKFLLLFFLPALLVGCNTWLDVNTDPNNPKDVPMALLLPTIELNAAYALAPGQGINEDLAVYMHQVTTREEANVYNADGNEFYLNQSWNSMYVTTLQNLDNVILKAKASNAPYYAGIGKIIKAYMFSQYVDMFGDVPFSQANKKLTDLILYPKFDKSADIYPQLIALLDSGILDMKQPVAAITPGTDDLIYGGVAASWIKTANTIKFKLLVQTRNVGDKAANLAAINAFLAATPATQLIGKTADGFMFPYTSLKSPDSRHPAYPATYEATQKTVNMSPWFYEILKGINPVFSGVVDPRIPYYFYNQMKPAATSGNNGNKFEYRDGGFVTIYFGSNGPDNGSSQDASQTVYGIYPCGGRYDQGDAKIVTGTSGTGAAPFRFLTYADRLFLEAEVIQAGGGDATAKLTAAITEAFKLVDYVAAKANVGQTIPVLAGSVNVTSYTNAILGLFASANATKRMEIIMTQKWISSFGNSIDQYTDYRRTGYPVLFNPNLTGSVTPPIGGDPARITGTDPAVAVSCPRGYPRSLPWSNSNELDVNKNAPAQKTDLTVPFVFWDVK